jgi:hypothetical protein
MENNPTTEPKFKLLKITNAHGVVNYIPDNRMNRNHHETFKKALSKEKREKYLIEEVVLTTEEASDLGVAEAYYILHPPAKKQAAQSNSGNGELMELLKEQIAINREQAAANAELNKRLEALETPKTPKK